MSFAYFEVTAEVGIRAKGSSYEEAFAEAAKGLFELMVDTSEVHPLEKKFVRACSESLDLLLADWLNQLIVERDRSGFVFSEFRVRINKNSQGWKIETVAMGEFLNRERHDPRIDVKAVTYNGLKCYEQEGIYTVECVLDV
ncbi:archease [Candidatus Acetothermia bacterium]|nr:archease [Candidatus Acetothermia bacterium]MBI3459617.1 archease [Candidatus Acetothermia bacterium]MBI3659996.1 archease [Candidatus Acetothermia bacterium]